MNRSSQNPGTPPVSGESTHVGANNSGAQPSPNVMISTAAISGRTSVVATEEPGTVSMSDERHAWILHLMTEDGPGIQRLLWRILGREADVMDAYQDCFCKLAQLTGDRKPLNARAYAYRMASNIAIELIRSRRRRNNHWDNVVATRAQRANDDADEREPDDAPAQTHQDRLREAVAGLPNHLRNVVVLRDLSKMSYNDVGRILGIEPTTARVYRRHAVVQLAALLGAAH